MFWKHKHALPLYAFVSNFIISIKLFMSKFFKKGSFLPNPPPATCITISIFLWARLTNYYVWISLFACIAFGLVGFLDDYKKIYSKSSYGLKASTRIILQIVLAFIIIFLIESISSSYII